MVFSSIIFLFLFLPLTLFFYYIVGKRLRNSLLLLASLLFYAWGEQFYVVVMLGSIGLNYLFGLFLDNEMRPGYKKAILAVGVLMNLGLLFFFKYSNFFVEILNSLLKVFTIEAFDIPPAHLPIGISFFSFQALSYIVDVYRKTCPVQKNPFSLGLYIASFPQLIAGPIVRYRDVAIQIVNRSHSLELFTSGIERFVIGLAKKVLLANAMGGMADAVFGLEPIHLSSGTAWLGIICYTLQIYFDFSGYSDMAIGLGRMFGFQFLENFNYPYIARSVQEFWRRWHISLSNWFRDYLYIPLGGNRKGRKRTAFNLFTVFLLCGLWHGASWNFILWGCVYGCFLIAERGRLGIFIRRLPQAMQHLYLLLIVINAWVLFRAETLKEAGNYFVAMYGGATTSRIHPLIAVRMDQLFLVTLFAALAFSLPLYPSVLKMFRGKDSMPLLAELGVPLLRVCTLGALLLLSVGQLAVGSYNPFIYFRF